MINTNQGFELELEKQNIPELALDLAKSWLSVELILL